MVKVSVQVTVTGGKVDDHVGDLLGIQVEHFGDDLCELGFDSVETEIRYRP